MARPRYRDQSTTSGSARHNRMGFNRSRRRFQPARSASAIHPASGSVEATTRRIVRLRHYRHGSSVALRRTEERHGMDPKSVASKIIESWSGGIDDGCSSIHACSPRAASPSSGRNAGRSTVVFRAWARSTAANSTWLTLLSKIDVSRACQC